MILLKDTLLLLNIYFFLILLLGFLFFPGREKQKFCRPPCFRLIPFHLTCIILYFTSYNVFKSPWLPNIVLTVIKFILFLRIFFFKIYMIWIKIKIYKHRLNHCIINWVIWYLLKWICFRFLAGKFILNKKITILLY